MSEENSHCETDEQSVVFLAVKCCREAFNPNHVSTEGLISPSLPIVSPIRCIKMCYSVLLQRIYDYFQYNVLQITENFK